MELKTLTQIFFSSPFVLALGSAVIPPIAYHCGSLATFRQRPGTEAYILLRRYKDLRMEEGWRYKEDKWEAGFVYIYDPMNEDFQKLDARLGCL